MLARSQGVPIGSWIWPWRPRWIAQIRSQSTELGECKEFLSRIAFLGYLDICTWFPRNFFLRTRYNGA